MDNEFRSGNSSAAGGAREKVREKAAEVAGKAKEQIEGRYDEQKSRAMSEVNNLASALRRAGDDLGGGGLGSTVLSRVAGHLESFGGSLDGKNLDDIVSDVERLARRNPAVFIGGAMLIGFAASRFLKSSSRATAYGYEGGFDIEQSGDFNRDFYGRGSDFDSSFGTSRGMGSPSGFGTTGSGLGNSGIGTPGGIGNTGVGSSGTSTTGGSGIGTGGTGSSGFETTGNTGSNRGRGGNSGGSAGGL